MAKQVGDIKITGTIGGITFYKMEGQYYARRQSSLKGTRVKKDPRFKRTMASAHRLARGSQLASRVYRSLPKAGQVYGLFTKLKSLAIRVLKEGKSESEVLQLLQQQLVPQPAPAPYCAAQPKKEPLLPRTPPSVKKLFGARNRKQQSLPGCSRILRGRSMVQRE